MQHLPKKLTKSLFFFPFAFFLTFLPAFVTLPEVVKAQIVEDREAQADRLYEEAFQLWRRGEFRKALAKLQQALVIFQKTSNRKREGDTLTGIGVVYYKLGNYPQAIEYYQQALAILKEVGDRAGEGTTLNNLGLVYDKLGNYPQAIEYYQQALAIRQEVSDRAGVGETLNNLGYILESQNQPEIAIIFFKQSVNTFELIRKDNRQLSQELQQSYTETIASTYRTLADLLLSQDRILEAQRVLDLLKVQELDEYLRGVRSNENTESGIAILRPEQEIIAKYSQLQTSAIELGSELANLRQIPESQRTSQQQQRVEELVQLQKEINRQFNAFIDSDEIIALVDQLSRTAKKAHPELEELNALRDNLEEIGNAALFYPLILEDRLELVITTPNSPPLRRTVQGVGREKLNKTILQFRQSLKAVHPRFKPKIPAQKLYQWLIAPIEEDLIQAGVETIIYAPDGQLRYIPLAALHDGEQWLVQKYRVNNITAASLTDFTTKPQSQPKVLAAAFADETIEHSFKVGKEDFFFKGLPFAGVEVDNLIASLPNITSFIDRQFSLKAVEPRLNEHNIVHFATHAAFVVGTPENSFILFGNGDIPNLTEIKDWSLENVDLVVLSACETGLGGEFGNGEEILGLGYQFQRAGARATLASLWKVSDGGTQALMNAFYAALQQSGVSKAEAIQKAQIALITGDYSDLEGERATVAVEYKDRLPQNVQKNLSHPYYWSAFFLIGNGL